MADSKKNSPVVASVRHAGEAAIVALRGEIDLHNSPTVRTALLDLLEEKKPARLVINLAEVPYVDSSAIAVLVESLQKMRKIGGKVYLVEPQPRVQGLLEIARLDSIFIVTATEDDALK